MEIIGWSVKITRGKKTIAIGAGLGTLLALLDFLYEWFTRPLLVTGIGFLCSILVVVSVHSFWRSRVRGLARRLLALGFFLCLLLPLVFLFSFGALLLFNYYYAQYPDGEEVGMIDGQMPEELKVSGGVTVYTVNVPYKGIVTKALEGVGIPSALRIDFWDVKEVIPHQRTCVSRGVAIHRDDKTAGVISARFSNLVEADGCTLTIQAAAGNRVFARRHYLRMTRFQEVVRWFGAGYYKRFSSS